MPGVDEWFLDSGTQNVVLFEIDDQRFPFWKNDFFHFEPELSIDSEGESI